MKNLTEDSIVHHILTMAVPIGVGMMFQTLYYLVDLYFISPLGHAAVAGVGAAGSVAFLVLALTQILSVGTSALIAHAVGRKDQSDAKLIFNQALMFGTVCGLLVLAIGLALTGSYMRSVSADAATVQAGTTYLHWYMVGLALQFVLLVMGSGLRGTGIVKPTLVTQIASVLLNAVLAPVLISGWGTRHPLGVAGAGLASSVSGGAALIMLSLYFRRVERYIDVDLKQWRPNLRHWRRILDIGLPTGGEYVLMFVYQALVYWGLRGFGSVAQAGFGIGYRVVQAMTLPALALAFAAATVAGQNYTAGRADRVLRTFHTAVALIAGIMIALAIFVHWRPELLVRAFARDDQTLSAAVLFMQLISWAFVAQGLALTCSSLFQAFGNTRPALLSCGVRVLAFAVPIISYSTRPSFRVEYIWYLSIATLGLQAFVSLVLLNSQFHKRLGASHNLIRVPHMPVSLKQEQEQTTTKAVIAEPSS